MPYIGSGESLPALTSGKTIAVGKDSNGDYYKDPTHDISIEDVDGTRKI